MSVLPTAQALLAEAAAKPDRLPLIAKAVRLDDPARLAAAAGAGVIPAAIAITGTGTAIAVTERAASSGTWLLPP